jgi:hypothetical protein
MFEEKDVGKWTCLVGVVNGSEVTTAEGHAQVRHGRSLFLDKGRPNIIVGHDNSIIG